MPAARLLLPKLLVSPPSLFPAGANFSLRFPVCAPGRPSTIRNTPAVLLQYSCNRVAGVKAGRPANQTLCYDVSYLGKARRFMTKGRKRDVSRGQDAPFGTLLKRLREASGLTQEELAARAALSAKGISDLERGARRRPHPQTVRALADALELSEDGRASLLATVPKRSGVPTAPMGVPESALP